MSDRGSRSIAELSARRFCIKDFGIRVISVSSEMFSTQTAALLRPVPNHFHMAQTIRSHILTKEKFNLKAIHIKCLVRNETISNTIEEILTKFNHYGINKGLSEAEPSLFPLLPFTALTFSRLISYQSSSGSKNFSFSPPRVRFIEDSGFAMWKLIRCDL